MHWILQDGFFSESGWEAMVSTLERFEISYSVHTVVPGVGHLKPEPVLAHTNVICLGSYTLRHMAVQNAWRPGVFDLYGEDFEKQRERWGEHMLNHRAYVCKLDEACFTEPRMFVRPLHDSKSFSGKVFTAEEFVQMQRSVREGRQVGSLSGQTEIILSEPQSIYAEYRFWVVKRTLITSSLYKRGNQVFYSSEVNPRIIQFARERVAEWAPHDAFVLDVCETPKGLKIVEINTINSSAFYAADVQRLVLALEEAFTE